MTTRRRRLAILLLPAILVLGGGVGAVAWLGAGASGDPMVGSGGTGAMSSVTVSIRFGAAAGKPPIEKTVSVPEGASVLDAVRAAGVPVTTTDEADAESCCGTGMVHAIDGVAASAASRSGWMYSVNGAPPPVGPGDMRVGNGDVVVWTYR